jgi:PTS system ascorbate-specific IIC component
MLLLFYLFNKYARGGIYKMDVLQGIVDFVTGQIFNDVTKVFGIVALLGLVLQRKKIEDVFTGTLRTMIGWIVLFAGVLMLFENVAPATEILRQGFGGELVAGALAEGRSAEFFVEYGPQFGIIIVGAFIVNLILARITPFKIVYMTVHLLLQNAWVFVAILLSVTAWSIGTIVIVSILFLGFWQTFIPWATLPWSRKVIGSDDFTLGHGIHLNVIITSWLASKIGNPEDSAEDIEFPERLSFMGDPVLMTIIIFTALYLVGVIAAGPGWVQENYAGDSNVWIWMVMSAVYGGTGMAILFYGVKMLLEELVAAFRGIARRLVPGAIPALDMPVFFGYAPNSLMIGFVVHLIVGTIIMFIVAGVAPLYIVFPAIVPAFFDAGTCGIFGNAAGGKRGAVLGGVVSAVIDYGGLVFLIPLVLPMVDYVRQFALSDYTLVFNAIGQVIRLFTGMP